MSSLNGNDIIMYQYESFHYDDQVNKSIVLKRTFFVLLIYMIHCNGALVNLYLQQ